MTLNSLNMIILEEHKALSSLLEALNEQFNYITKKEVFKLDKVREKLENCSREVAKFEVERRKITDGRAMKEIILSLNSEELEKNYNNIVSLLNEVQFQKDTNEMLIRQNLGFVTQMLSVINPDRSPKTYNTYGKRR